MSIVFDNFPLNETEIQEVEYNYGKCIPLPTRSVLRSPVTGYHSGYLGLKRIKEMTDTIDHNTCVRCGDRWDYTLWSRCEGGDI